MSNESQSNSTWVKPAILWGALVLILVSSIGKNYEYHQNKIMLERLYAYGFSEIIQLYPRTINCDGKAVRGIQFTGYLNGTAKSGKICPGNNIIVLGE